MKGNLKIILPLFFILCRLMKKILFINPHALLFIISSVQFDILIINVFKSIRERPLESGREMEIKTKINKWCLIKLNLQAFAQQRKP